MIWGQRKLFAAPFVFASHGVNAAPLVILRLHSEEKPAHKASISDYICIFAMEFGFCGNLLR